MEKENNKWAFSLGGSVFIPEEIDSEYLKSFSAMIKKYVKKGHVFRIVTGGGFYCRKYMKAMQESEYSTQQDEYWIGTLITRLNAELLKSFFPKKDCYSKVVLDYANWQGTNKPIAVGGGDKIGHSSDYDAFHFALAEGIKTVINITNVEYVYDRDPRKDRNAKPLKKLSWKEYLELVGKEFNPGENFPFDPIASKACSEHNISVIITNRVLGNIEKILQGKDFKGTLLHP
jgi:uridylate kinase